MQVSRKGAKGAKACNTSSYIHSHNPLRFVKLHFKQIQHYRIHPVLGKGFLAAFRKEDREIKDGLNELGATTEICSPLVKSGRPVVHILLEVVAAIPQKLQLV